MTEKGGTPDGESRLDRAAAVRHVLGISGTAPHVAVTGTERGATEAQLDALGDLLLYARAEWLHHGDCLGADAQAHGVARSLGLRVYVHPPEAASRRAWCSGDSSERPAPYLVRDRMLVSRVGLLVALPLGVLHGRCREGTCATARQAVRTGVPVLEVRPNGLALPWPPPVRSGP